MSSYTDERVVEMRFDNKKFETNVAKSMKTLDKLKAKLNFKNDGVQSFEAIEEAASKMDLSDAERSINHLMKQFSVLDAFHLNMINAWGKRLFDFAEKQAKALSIDNYAAGWTKYEQKAASVQTIMNSTGLSIEKVNGYLDKLMWYSDETSYSFSDMTQALGTMLAAGGDINKLIPMIEGMANATSYAGKGASEFNRVLYNLNQSYSQGFLSLMDWKSVQLAGVNSKALIDTLIDTGVALGKIKKGEVNASNFTSTLAKKWADAEVMEEGFRKFAEATEEAYKMVERGEVATASEAYERLSKTMTGVGITAAKAAQEAKSFGEAMTSVKDAVATKFMTVFEYVFGNYQEAKVTWTNLANDLWEIFAGPFDDVVEMSGFDALTSGARAVEIDMDKLKDKLVELAIAEGTLTEADAMAGDLFGELADKSWITQKLYADAVESLGVTNKKNIDELKATWNDWQKLQYSEWVEKGGRALEDLQEWELNVLGTTKEQVAEYAIATNQFADYAKEIRDVNGEYSELIEHINDPGQYKMGYTEIIRKAFAESSLSDISLSLDEAGLSIYELEESLKSVGIATGKVTEQMISDSGGLVQSFTSGWLDRDTYVAALEDYAKKQSEAAEDIQAGMTAEQQYWYDRLVVQGGKTIDQMAQWELDAIGINGQNLIAYNERMKQINAYIDAVRKGEALTDEIFAGLIDRTGQQAIAGSIKNITDALSSLTGLFSNVLDVIFPFSDEDKVAMVRNLALGIENFTSKLIISEETAEAITNAFGTLADVVKFAWTAIMPIRDAFGYIAHNALDLAVKNARALASWFLDVVGNFHLWLEDNNRLENVASSIAGFFRGMYTVAGKFFKRIKNTGITFADIRNTITEAYAQIRNWLSATITAIDPKGHIQAVINGIVAKLTAFKELVSDIAQQKFDKVDAFLDSIFDSARTVKNNVFENISNWALNIANTVTSAFNAVRTVTAPVFKWIGDMAVLMYDILKTYIGPENFENVTAFLKFFMTNQTLASINKMLFGVSAIIKSFGKLADGVIAILTVFTDVYVGIKRFGTGIKRLGTGFELAGLGLFIYGLGKGLEALKGFSWKEDWQALTLIAAMLTVMLVVIAILGKINTATEEIMDNDGKKNKKKSNGMLRILESLAALLLLSASIVAMAFALKYIMEAVGSNPDELWPSLAIIGAVLTVSALALAMIGEGFKDVDTKGLAATLIALPLALAGVLYAVKMLADYLEEILSEAPKEGMMPKINYIYIAIATVAATLAAIVFAVNRLGHLDINMGVAATILSIAAILYITGTTVDKLAGTFDEHGWPALYAMVTLFGGILLILQMLKGFTNGATVSLKAAGTILAFGLVLAELAVIVSLMSLIPADSLKTSALAIGGVILAFGAAMWAASKLTDKMNLKGIGKMTVLLALLVGGIFLLDRQIGNAIDILWYGITLAGVIAAMAGMMAIAGKLTNEIKWAPIVATILMFTVLALGIAGLEHHVKDIKKFAIIAGLLALTLVAAAGAMLIVSNITKAINIGSVLLTIGALAAVAVAIVAITMAFAKISRVEMKNVAPILIALAGGLFALAAVSALLGAFPIGLAGVAGAILLLVGLDITVYAIANAFDMFVGAMERLTPILPDFGANIEDMSKKIGDADLEVISNLFSTFAGSVDQYTGAFSSLKKLADAGAFAIVANALGPMADALIGINPSLPSLGANIRDFSKNLQGTDFNNLKSILTVSASPVRELVDIAGDAFLPLVGLAIAAKLVNGAITGLGEKLYNVALGVSGIRMSLDFGGELGQTFANSILSVSPYAQVAVQAVAADTLKAVEDIDISDAKANASQKGTEITTSLVEGMDPSKVDKSIWQRIGEAWNAVGQFVDGVFGIETEGNDPWEAMHSAITGDPKGYWKIGNFWDDWSAYYFAEANGRVFDYNSAEDWAEVLGVDPEVIHSMFDIAVKIATENADEAASEAYNYVFSDPKAIPDTVNMDYLSRSGYINSLYRQYLIALENATEKSSNEPDPSTETAIEHTAEVIAEDAVDGLNEVRNELEEQVIEELDEQSNEITAEGKQKAVEDKVRKMAEQIQPGAIDEQTVAKIAAEYNGSDSDLSAAVMTAVTERKQKKDGNIANQTGLFVNGLLNGKFDPSLIAPAVAEWTAENFGTQVPESLRNALAEKFGTTDVTDILSKVQGMTTEDWSSFAKDYFGVMAADFIPEGGMDEFLKPLLESLGLDQLDLQSLLGTFQGHFTDSLPADYFDGTAAKFTEAGNSSIDAFVAALQTDQGNIEKLQAAAVTLGETLTAPINEKLSENSMIKIGEVAIAALGSGITSRRQVAVTAAESARSAIIAELNAYTNTYQVGINYMLGIKKGLTDTEADVNDTIIRIGKDMVQKMYEAIHSNSPAKDTMPIGRYFMQGVQVGIMDEETNTFHTIDEIAASAVDHMAEAIMLANAVVSNAVDDQPTIKPLMDLSEIEYGAARMNNLLSTQAATRVQMGRESTVADPSTNVQNGGSVVNYTQNNYSPKSLSRIEIYRQTRNQLATLHK